MPLFKHKIALDGELMKRVRAHVERMGYASVEEFVHHCIEKELTARQAADEDLVTQRLRGLGYVE